MARAKKNRCRQRRGHCITERYKCPKPFHEVRTRFMGSIASPALSIPPLQTVKQHWGGELPAFDTIEDLNELLNILVSGLWNQLTTHQSPDNPFLLTTLEVKPSREGLRHFALVRQQEFEGFEGLFGTHEAVDLPDSVGVGTGRDAAWLARRGLEVVVVEPSTAMREEGRRIHTDARIQWINDSLPNFRDASRLGLTFDFILLSAVWMHIPESDRPRAFRKLITLLKPGGVIAMSLRQGPADADRGMHPVSDQEIERQSRVHPSSAGSKSPTSSGGRR